MVKADLNEYGLGGFSACAGDRRARVRRSAPCRGRFRFGGGGAASAFFRRVIRSPRGWFVENVRQATTDDSAAHLALDRWGFGASYHEFECALGEDVHEWVIADGYEPIILALHRPGFDDALVAFLFAQLNLKKHRAFTRYWLHLIVRKPA